MRALFFGVLFLLVASVAAVLVVPSFFDWNGQKERIAAEISNITGRALQIDGDVSLELLPTPRLTAADVRLANIEGASNPNMAVIEALEVQVDFWPLLRGRVQIESFALVRPQIFLEVLPDGRRNWNFAAGSFPGVGERLSDERDRRIANQIKLEDFRIVEGRLVYRDQKGSEIIEDLSAEISAASLLGPFSLVGAGIWHGNEVRAVVNLGRVVKEGAATINLDIAFPGEQANLRFNGGVLRDRSGLGLRGQLSSDGEDLAGLLAVLNPSADPLPRDLARPFDITTEVRLDSEVFHATDLSARLHALQIEGSVRVSLTDQSTFDADLTSRRLDLDGFLGGSTVTSSTPKPAEEGDEAKVATEEAAPEKPAETPDSGDGGLLTALAGKFSLPKDLTGRVKLTADSLVFRERLVRQVELEADLLSGRLAISQAKAQMPGGSEISLTGDFSTPKRTPRFVGQVETSSNNFRVLLNWLDVDISSVPANRLRKMNFASEVSLEQGQLTANQFDLRVDLTKAKGGLALALRDRPGFGLGMNVDSLNLDAYMAAPGAEGVDAPLEGSPEASEDEAEGKPVKKPGQGFDRSAERVALDWGGILNSFDANFDITVGVLTIKGSQAKGIHLDGTLREGEMTLREARVADFFGASGAYRGDVRDLRGDTFLDGRFDFEIPSPNRLWKNLTGVKHDFGDIGAVQGAGSLRGSPAKPHVDGRVEAYGGSLAMIGDIEVSIFQFDLSFDAEHPSFPKLLKAMGRKAPVDRNLGAAIITGELTGDPMMLRFDNLAGQVGDTDFAGEMSIDASRPRLYLEVDLDTGPLSLPLPFAKVRNATASRAASGQDTSTGQARELSRTPFSLSWLSDVDGVFNLRGDAFEILGVRLDNATLNTRLDDGVATVEELAGELYGGQVLVTGRFSGAHELVTDFTLDARDLDARQVMDTWLGVDAVSGSLNLEGAFQSSGNSQASLVRDMVGQGHLEGSLALALPDAATGLRLLAPEVTPVNGGEASALERAFDGAPIALDGDFDISDGALSSENLKLGTKGATALSVGAVDLGSWTISSRTDLYRAEAPDRVYLSATLQGPLTAPDVKITGEPLQPGQDQ